jgi:hypothetical protein
MTDKNSVVGMNHLAISELSLGLILAGKQSATKFDADSFVPAYAKAFLDFKKGMTMEELYAKHGNLIQAAQFAAKSVNGLGDTLDWANLLNQKYRIELIKQQSEALNKSLDAFDFEKAGAIVQRQVAALSASQRYKSIRASNINLDGYTKFIPSGAKAWDAHIGGWPSQGLIIYGGKSYTGKTAHAIGLMSCYLEQYPEREIMFITAEDMNEGWKNRAVEILGKKPDSFWERVHVMESVTSADEIIAECSRFPKVAAVFVDFIDMILRGKNLEAYADFYITISTGVKALAINNEFRSMVAVVLAQFGKTLYKGGVPTPDCLPFSGFDFAYQMCIIYDPEGDFYSDNQENAYYLAYEKGYAYMTVWKVKNGRPHDPEFPGALKLPISKRLGFDWSAKGEWVSLSAETKRPVQNKRK